MFTCSETPPERKAVWRMGRAGNGKVESRCVIQKTTEQWTKRFWNLSETWSEKKRVRRKDGAGIQELGHRSRAGGLTLADDEMNSLST